MDIRELADTALVCDKLKTYLDDSRKELGRVGETAEKLACLMWATQSTDGEPIRTQFVTATPDIKMAARIPKRDREPEKYRELMRHLGVPEAITCGAYEAMRPHWPGMVAHLSDLQERGLPLPAGIDPDSTYPIYSLKLRAKKEVDAPATQDVTT